MDQGLVSQLTILLHFRPLDRCTTRMCWRWKTKQRLVGQVWTATFHFNYQFVKWLTHVCPLYRNRLWLWLCQQHLATVLLWTPFIWFCLQNFCKVINVSEGVTFSLTAQLPCQLQAYWGVTIKDVFPAVYQTWLQFSHQFQDGTLLKDSCLAIDEKIQYPWSYMHNVYLSPMPNNIFII